MEIQEHMREYMATEFYHVSKAIKEAVGDMPSVVYNFSACRGAISRALNVEFNGNLVLLHTVFSECYSTIANRSSMINQNSERPIQFPPQFSEKLSRIVEEFAVRFHENRDVLDLLPSLTTLCYVATGNGYFLYQTGRLKI